MSNIIKLQTIYDDSLRPAWTLKEVIHQKARYVKFTELGRYAQFFLTIEPWDGEFRIAFVNEAALQGDMAGNAHWQGEFDRYVKMIIKTIVDELNERYANGIVIVNIKVTLSDLSIHEVDSSEISYRIATHLALKEALDVSKLIPIN